MPGIGNNKNHATWLIFFNVSFDFAILVSIVGSLRDREVACSASDRQGSNFESCVWRTVSSQSSHHPQEVLLAQFSLYVHKGGLKPDSFHFIFISYTLPLGTPIYRFHNTQSHIKSDQPGSNMFSADFSVNSILQTLFFKRIPTALKDS